MITNACATQAILSILLNSRTIELGEELSNFKAFVSDFPAEVPFYSSLNLDSKHGKRHAALDNQLSFIVTEIINGTRSKVTQSQTRM